MTTETVQYNLQGRVATIRIDDGKRNALSPQVLTEIYRALDWAESDRAIVIITGRESVFSAGFDLRVMKRGGIDALRMLGSGYALTARVLAYPYPVIAACNGHVLAMGVFLMLSADYVIGSRGDFRIAANEVAIGLKMPRVAAAMLRHRLTPTASPAEKSLEGGLMAIDGPVAQTVTVAGREPLQEILERYFGSAWPPAIVRMKVRYGIEKACRIFAGDRVQWGVLNEIGK
jgi:enoyl-CoA hydratase/carnithine racemase